MAGRITATGLFLGIWFTSFEASACQPIIPLFQALAGPGFVAPSLIGLAAAVLIKCAAFACYEKSLPKARAFSYMLLGNVVTTIVGVLVAGFAAAPMAFLGLLLLFAATYYGARQLQPRVPWPWLQAKSPWAMAWIACLMLFISTLFFGMAMAQADPPPFRYWVLKTMGLIVAILINMALSTFYEEWTVHFLARKPKEPPNFCHAVVRANLLTLFIIMGCTAAYILPQRFASPFFTIVPR